MTIERLRLANNGLIEVHSEGPMCWYDDYEELQQSKNVLPPTRGTDSQHSAWVSVKDRLPKRYEEVIIWPHPTDYIMTAELYGESASGSPVWKYGEYVTGFGHEMTEMTRVVTHWMPKPTKPVDVDQPA